MLHAFYRVVVPGTGMSLSEYVKTVCMFVWTPKGTLLAVFVIIGFVLKNQQV